MGFKAPVGHICTKWLHQEKFKTLLNISLRMKKALLGRLGYF